MSPASVVGQAHETADDHYNWIPQLVCLRKRIIARTHCYWWQNIDSFIRTIHREVILDMEECLWAYTEEIQVDKVILMSVRTVKTCFYQEYLPCSKCENVNHQRYFQHIDASL